MVDTASFFQPILAWLSSGPADISTGSVGVFSLHSSRLIKTKRLIATNNRLYLTSVNIFWDRLINFKRFFVKQSMKNLFMMRDEFMLLPVGASLFLSFLVISCMSEHMTHTLPTDSEAIVIQWRTIGGLSIYRDNTADLTIYANGKTIVGPRFSQGKIVESRLTPDQIQQLLSFVVDDNEFFSFDAKAVEEAVNEALEQRRETSQEAGAIAVPLGPPYIDAGTTIILIAADGKHHEVRYQGLFFAAQDFPEIGTLQHLRSIELKLLSVAEEIANSASY
jgi:hypothetical protein